MPRHDAKGTLDSWGVDCTSSCEAADQCSESVIICVGHGPRICLHLTSGEACSRYLARRHKLNPPSLVLWLVA
jgi:hypothetical protein